MPGPTSRAVRDAATVPDSAVSDATTDGTWKGAPGSEEDELVGATFNDTYVVEGVIGEGGMGRVYRARHTRIAQKQFAIKVVRPELTRNTEVLARFRREAEAAACVSNSNVVGVYDVGSTPEGWNYLVCEYLDGIDLAAHIEKVKRVDVATAVHIAYNVCDGLAAAHAEGVIHRDLKPHNVFLIRDKSGFIAAHPPIKLLDFGLSRFQDAGDTDLTKTGVIMGTPAYMAPEQASGKRVDHRADVYGVGAILYVALTGRPPFVEETVQLVVLSVLGKDPVRPRELNPEIPETLELVIQKAMAKDPDERYQTVEELARALEPFLLADAKAASVGRPPLPTRGSLEAEAHEIRSARARLVMLAIFGFVALIAALASAVTGVELLTGKLTLTPTELSLLLLAVFGTSLTPTLLLLRSFKKRVWHSNVKVLEALEQLKAPIMVALMAYGLAGIAIRLVDHVVGRFAWQSLMRSGVGAGWPGWNLILPLIALCAAGATVARRRWLKGDVSSFRRWMLGFPYGTVVVVALVAVLYGGFKWRAHAAHAVLPAPEVPQAKAAAVVSGSGSGAVLPKAELSQVPERERPIKRAPEDELTAAVAKGVDGLLPLSERYPRDAAVLKPLMFAFASRATSLADAISIAQRLIRVAPEEAADGQVRYLIRKGAQTPGQAAKLAFDLMVHDMGRSGPDLLYDLWLTSPKARERAAQLLENRDVREKFSPELAIAYDLRKAKSCEGKVPLLERAAQLGDERSLAQLSPLATKSKRGCGRWKRNPCPAPCAKQAREYMIAIRAISKRVNAQH